MVARPGERCRGGRHFPAMTAPIFGSETIGFAYKRLSRHQKGRFGSMNGEFIPWVKANCEFSPETARDYMRMAKPQNGDASPFCGLAIRI